MDGDPAVEPELDAFSLFLPLPFRVATTVVFGVWAWGLNLHGLSLLKIDVPALIRYPPRISHTQLSHYLSTYRFASALTIPLFIALVLFWLITRFRSLSVTSWELIPNLYLLVLVIAFIFPSRIAQNGRKRFLQVLRRVSIGGIAETGDGKFGDILMADVLTSYAKVLGDLFVALCMMLTRRHSTAAPDRSCGGVLIVPVLISVPSLIRFRQCITEYLRVKKANEAGGMSYSAHGWGGQHLANALKYASALPVVLFSSLQRGPGRTALGISDTATFRLWMISVFVNSFYSFYWDVAKDWDLHLFSRAALRSPPPIHIHSNSSSGTNLLSHPNGNSSTSPSLLSHADGSNGSNPPDPSRKPQPAYPYGLRRHRYFHLPYIYYVVIFMDLLLRCTWSFKLSPHLDHFNDLEAGIWVMELLEVFRRWVWVFFRVETEWVRQLKGEAERSGIQLLPGGSGGPNGVLQGGLLGGDLEGEDSDSE